MARKPTRALSTPAKTERPKAGTPRSQKRSDPDQASGEPPLSLTVLASVRRDLATIAERSPALATSALAATALALARELDNDNSATSKSMCAKALLDTMDRLRELGPPPKERDGIDDLKDARRARRARSTTAAR